MKINGRDITLTSEELDLLKKLKANGVISITKSDEDDFMWHDGNFSTQGSTINVRWFKGFDWMGNDEIISVQNLLDISKKPKTVWDLEDGDALWWISSSGFVDEDKWKSGCFNVNSRSQGNVFLTEEEAKFESKRREVYANVKKYARPYTPDRVNWYPYYDHCDKKIRVDFDGGSQLSHYYFASEKDIADAIAEVGEDDFKKYYLGVTDNA